MPPFHPIPRHPRARKVRESLLTPFAAGIPSCRCHLVPPSLCARAPRCAIYTRKSTEEGLDQAFNTLDAQREAAEAYIASQQHEGWVCLPDRYDDGGYTGANMERPALNRLIHDIEAGRVDGVVVYKVDRLSRSLLDFARLMESLMYRCGTCRHRLVIVSRLGLMIWIDPVAPLDTYERYGPALIASIASWRG